MGWFCNNIIEYLLLGKDFLWSKAINLLNMSLKDSPGTCTVNVIGFVICLNTHKHYICIYLCIYIMCCMKFSSHKNHICWRCKLSDMTSRPLAIHIWWSTYSASQLLLCTTFLFLLGLLSHSGCSSAYDIQVWSHTHHILPKEAKETLKFCDRKLRNSNFSFVKKLW